MYRVPATFGLVAVLLLGAAPAIPDWALTADLEVLPQASPHGQIETCVDDVEQFFIGLQVNAVGLAGFRRYNVGARPADITVTLDGKVVATAHAFYTSVAIQFQQIGRHTVRVTTANLDWGIGNGNVFYETDTVSVDVIECHYLVEARGVIHMNDGGFQPVLGGVIASAKLTWVPVARRFVGSAEQSNVAVAFPQGGCVPSFTVEPTHATLAGFVTSDGLSFHLEIDWVQGAAKVAGTGVRCLIVSGGRTNTFTISPYRSDLPAFGVTTANAPLEPWTMTTQGGSYTGFIFVALTKVHGA